MPAFLNAEEAPPKGQNGAKSKNTSTPSPAKAESTSTSYQNVIKNPAKHPARPPIRTNDKSIQQHSGLYQANLEELQVKWPHYSRIKQSSVINKSKLM